MAVVSNVDYGEFKVQITYEDPGNQFAALPLLIPTINAAVQYVGQYVKFAGTVDIVVFAQATATGRISGNVWDLSAGPSDGQGRTIAVPTLQNESRTGIDTRPQQPDIAIFIDQLPSTLWFDPNIASSLSGPVPDAKSDVFSIIVHELLHGLGIDGYRNLTTGAIAGQDISIWDTHVSLSGNRAWFSGSNVQALVGGPVEVIFNGTQSLYHLSNGPELVDSDQPWLRSDLMNGYFFYYGERYQIGALDLAILADLGWTIKPNTLADVTNRYEKTASEYYMVGSDAYETLTGGLLDDRIEARGGKDTLTGGKGNDTIDGGDGIDTVRFADSRAASLVHMEGEVMVVATPSEGIDRVRNVEFFEFADGTFSVETLRGFSTDPASYRLFAPAGAQTVVGRSGAVFGSAGPQDVRVESLAGRVTFDPSFNRGDDIIRLAGNAGSWLIQRSGSSATLFRGETFVTVPIGAAGTKIVFDDGFRTLAVNPDDGMVTIGLQELLLAPSPVVSLPEGPAPAVPAGSAEGRIYLASGGNAVVQGNLTVFGTAGAEQIVVQGGNVKLDPSFNRGGDTVVLEQAASQFSVVQSGSSAVLTGPGETVTIPPGIGKTRIVFADTIMDLFVDGATPKLGDQVLAATPVPVRSPVTLDIGSPVNGLEEVIDLAAGAFSLVHQAGQSSYVRVYDFTGNDVVTIRGATAADYSFRVLDRDGDGLDDLRVQSKALPDNAYITLMNAVPTGAVVTDLASAQAAVGWNFIVFS